MIGKLNKEDIEEFLKENVLGRIGCHDKGKTFVVPVSYVYDGKYIIVHSVEGTKIRMMRKNPNICFEVDEMKSSTNWKSVIVWGIYQELTDERDRYYAMKLFVERMMKLKVSSTATPLKISEQRVHPHKPGSVRPVIYRILLEEKTGRYEKD